jgi:hypothetical protein
MANWTSSTPKEDKEKGVLSSFNSINGHQLNNTIVTTKIPTYGRRTHA